MTATQMIGVNLITPAVVFLVVGVLTIASRCYDTNEELEAAFYAALILTALAIITEWGLWLLL
jgi:hypothetical protein